MVRWLSGETVKWLSGFVVVICMAGHAFAQSVEIDSGKPIEIAANTLEVMQEKNQAIFSGNVIATQGSITMKSTRMTVFYKGGGEGVMGNGISKIVADGGVFFTSPRETAQGNRAVYDVNRKQINMVGNVILTRDKNILKGTQLTYNLATGKSTLSAASASGATSGGRVKGLFVPNNK